MSFWKTFLVSYASLLAVFAFVECVLPGHAPHHPAVLIAIVVLGIPACAAIQAWAETRRKNDGKN